MMVTELDIVRIAVLESEADTPLIVDGDRVLACPLGLEHVQPIAWRYAEVGELGRHMHGLELPQGPARHMRRDTPRSPGTEQILGLPIRERFDHAAM